ncbi:MAG: hypothetical protein GEV03_27545 [Streptosporangiales bacterium]|nr:hypothetical protein [Streptosporangiales bacterium]
MAAEIRDRLTPGSYLAITNFHDPGGDPRTAAIEEIFTRSPMGSGWFRPYPQHRMYLGDLELVPPGLCPINEWRPDEDTPTDASSHHLYVGGIGYRPTT